jgi:hypothetical protein
MGLTPHSGPATSWLDEELRKEKALVVGLRDQAEKQQILLADQAQRILALEDRLTKLQGQILRIPDVEEALRRTRDELVLMVSELRQEQQKREAEFLRNRRAEREQDVRALQETQAQLKRFDAVEGELGARQVEDRRLNEGLLRLEQGLEDILKRLSQRDEAHRQLADRVDHSAVRLGQTEEAAGSARKVQQDHLARLLVLEAALPKLEQQVGELQGVRQQLTQQQGELLESQRRADRDRTQTMTEWGRKLEEYAHQLEVWAEQLRFFSDQHEKMRRVSREVQELVQQVSQQQDQLRQSQRIAGEQLRNEFKEWRSENAHRWVQELDRLQKEKEGQDARNDAQDGRLAVLEQSQRDDLAAMHVLEERLATWHAEFLAEARRIRLAQLQALKMQGKGLQDILTELRGLLGEEET